MAIEKPSEDQGSPPIHIFSRTEEWKLTLFKYQYAFEAVGFTTMQSQYIIFMRWLYVVRRLDDGIVDHPIYMSYLPRKTLDNR